MTSKGQLQIDPNYHFLSFPCSIFIGLNQTKITISRLSLSRGNQGLANPGEWSPKEVMVQRHNGSGGRGSTSPNLISIFFFIHQTFNFFSLTRNITDPVAEDPLFLTLFQFSSLIVKYFFQLSRQDLLDPVAEDLLFLTY